MAGIRNSQKLVAGVGEVIYTVPAGKSATVSVQTIGANGFILAAQQTPISNNPLINTFAANTATVSISDRSNSTYMRYVTRSIAFNTTSGSLQTNAIVYTLGENGMTATTLNSNIYNHPVLDYRIGMNLLTNGVVGNDVIYGSTRLLQWNTNQNYKDLVSITRYTSYTNYANAGTSDAMGYSGVGAIYYAGWGSSFTYQGQYSRTAFVNASGTGTVVDVTTTDSSSGNSNGLRSYCINNGYSVGFNTPQVMINYQGSVGVMCGLYKTGAAPVIASGRTYTTIMSSGNSQYWSFRTLTGPANGTCPLWVRLFNNFYYVGMSDGTMWKWDATTSDQWAGDGTTGSTTVTQVTVPADVNFNVLPIVVSATEMHFAGTTSKFPKVMSTSDTFSDYSNTTYPSELAFATATVPNPKLVLNMGRLLTPTQLLTTQTYIKHLQIMQFWMLIAIS